MVSVAPTAGPVGIQFANEDAVLTADAAINKGQVCKLTLQTDSALPGHLLFDGATPAIATDGDFDADNATATGNQLHCFAVALEDISSGDLGSFRVKGIVDVLGGDTSVAELPLKPGADGELVLADAAGADNPTKTQRVVAISLETMADATIKKALFDGVNGIGMYSNA